MCAFLDRNTLGIDLEQTSEHSKGRSTLLIHLIFQSQFAIKARSSVFRKLATIPSEMVMSCPNPGSSVADNHMLTGISRFLISFFLMLLDSHSPVCHDPLVAEISEAFVYFFLCFPLLVYHLTLSVHCCSPSSTNAEARSFPKMLSETCCAH